MGVKLVILLELRLKSWMLGNYTLFYHSQESLKTLVFNAFSLFFFHFQKRWALEPVQRCGCWVSWALQLCRDSHLGWPTFRLQLLKETHLCFPLTSRAKFFPTFHLLMRFHNNTWTHRSHSLCVCSFHGHSGKPSSVDYLGQCMRNSKTALELLGCGPWFTQSWWVCRERQSPKDYVWKTSSVPKHLSACSPHHHHLPQNVGVVWKV